MEVECVQELIWHHHLYFFYVTAAEMTGVHNDVKEECAMTIKIKFPMYYKTNLDTHDIVLYRIA